MVPRVLQVPMHAIVEVSEVLAVPEAPVVPVVLTATADMLCLSRIVTAAWRLRLHNVLLINKQYFLRCLSRFQSI